MSASLTPRVVLVRRPSEYELLIQEHGTAEQVKFYLQTQRRSLGEVQERDARLRSALDLVQHAVPRSWRRASLLRSDLDRFVFEPNDMIVVVGQDGLVANVAKYLQGQLVIGVNPDPRVYEGVLVRHIPAAVPDLFADCAAGRAHTEERTMVAGQLDDGQRVLALNELFVGHESHQSARYRLILDGKEERQSSSGVIVSSGTGSTGWARSINLERHGMLDLPAPEEARLAFFVREAFPGSGFRTGLTCGSLTAPITLSIISEMNVGGVVFGDGIESDRVSFPWGTTLSMGVAAERLRLVA